ncbi:MAG: hypothetical protein Q9212_004498 [Teloschistes hypoglaucus]
MSEASLFTQAVPTQSSEFPWTSLPQEMKSHILSFADLSDLKSARLVCWNWAVTASPFLFEELWLTPWTLGQLEDKHSLQTIHPHVRSLVLFSETLPECSLKDWQKAYDEWQDSFRHLFMSDAYYSEELKKRKRPWLASEVEPRFKSYSDHFHRQARFVEELGDEDPSKAAGGKGFFLLQEAIKLFYNLSDVTIGDDRWFQNFQFCHNSGPSCCRTGKRWNVWQDLEDLEGLNPPYFDRDLPSFGHAFLSTVLKTLGHLRKNLTALYVGAIQFPTFESFKRLGREEFQAVNHIFCNLEKIVIVLNNDWNSMTQDEDENEVGQKWLANLLFAADKLQDIDISLPDEYEIQQDMLKLFWSRKTSLWKLRVANMTITEDLFSSFLHRNAQTLQEIEFNDVHLQDTHGDLGGNGWGNLLKPFAGMVRIQSILLLPQPWFSGWDESSKALLEDPTCAQLMGEGLCDGVWEYEKEKFEDLCRALNLVHDTIPVNYTVRLNAGFACAD